MATRILCNDTNLSRSPTTIDNSGSWLQNIPEPSVENLSNASNFDFFSPSSTLSQTKLSTSNGRNTNYYRRRFLKRLKEKFQVPTSNTDTIDGDYPNPNQSIRPTVIKIGGTISSCASSTVRSRASGGGNDSWRLVGELFSRRNLSTGSSTACPSTIGSNKSGRSNKTIIYDDRHIDRPATNRSRSMNDQSIPNSSIFCTIVNVSDGNESDRSTNQQSTSQVALSQLGTISEIDPSSRLESIGQIDQMNIVAVIGLDDSNASSQSTLTNQSALNTENRNRSDQDASTSATENLDTRNSVEATASCKSVSSINQSQFDQNGRLDQDYRFSNPMAPQLLFAPPPQHIDAPVDGSWVQHIFNRSADQSIRYQSIDGLEPIPTENFEGNDQLNLGQQSNQVLAPEELPRMYPPQGNAWNLVAAPIRFEEQADEERKGCCGSGRESQSTFVRWFVAVISIIGISCVIVGIVLGAMTVSGSTRLTLCLLMIGVGVVLITVSGIAWRLTTFDSSTDCCHSNCMISTCCLDVCGLRTATERRRRRRAIGILHGQPDSSVAYARVRNLHRRNRVGRFWNHPTHAPPPPQMGPPPPPPPGACIPPEFLWRPPPPSYHASMQEARMQNLFGYHRQCEDLRAAVGSPPPTYRSRHEDTNRRQSVSELVQICSRSTAVRLNDNVTQDHGEIDPNLRGNASTADCVLTAEAIQQDEGASLVLNEQLQQSANISPELYSTISDSRTASADFRGSMPPLPPHLRPRGPIQSIHWPPPPMPAMFGLCRHPPPLMRSQAPMATLIRGPGPPMCQFHSRTPSTSSGGQRRQSHT